MKKINWYISCVLVVSLSAFMACSSPNSSKGDEDLFCATHDPHFQMIKLSSFS